MKKQIQFFLVAVLILPCIAILSACGSSATIKSLEEYKAVADSYLATPATPTSAPLAKSVAIATAQSLTDFNFLVEMTVESTTNNYSGTAIIAGEKGYSNVTYPDASTPDETNYFDGNHYYWFSNDHDTWVKEIQSSKIGEVFVGQIQQLIEPNLYTKTERRNEHVYTLKDGAETNLISIMGIPYDAKVTINRNFLLLKVWEHVGDEVSLITMKFILGGQSVTIPNEALQGVDWDTLPSLPTVPQWHDSPIAWADPKDGAIELTWQDNGANDIYMWRINVNGQDFDLPRETLTYTINGLQNGIEYFITIRALNNLDGIVPGVPKTLSATPISVYSIRAVHCKQLVETGELVVNWHEPLETNGSQILEYRITLYSYLEFGQPPVETTVFTQDTSYVFDGMVEGNRYSVTIRTLFDVPPTQDFDSEYTVEIHSFGEIED